MSVNLSLQLELMSESDGVSPVVRESFQKIQDFLCSSSGGSSLANEIETIREVIREEDFVTESAFFFGRNGNIQAAEKTWFLTDGHPSNQVGKSIMVGSPKIARISLAAVEPATCTVTIFEHDGVSFTAKRTISLAAERKKVDIPGSGVIVSLGFGKCLAAQMTSGSAIGPQVSVLVEEQ